jgi:hypothetical protein
MLTLPARTVTRFVAPFVLAAVVWAGVLRLGDLPDNHLSVSADLDVSEGAVAALFLNEFREEPVMVQVTPGRRTYRFSGIFETVRVLRLDPTDAGDADIRLYGIDVQDATGTVLRHYGAAQLAQWGTVGVQIVERTAEQVRYHSLTADPYILAEIEPISALPPGDLRGAIAARLQDDAWLPCAALLPALLLLDVRPFGAYLRRMALVLAVLILGPHLFAWTLSLPWGSTPLDVAISRAAYKGESLPALQAASIASFAGCGLMALLVAWRYRSHSRSADPMAPRTHPGLGWFVGGCAAVLLVVTAPDLSALAAAIPRTEYQPHWDGDNMLYWAYWVAKSRLPYRDLWYPYGGLFLLDGPWPAGPLVQWGYTTARYALFLAALATAMPARRLGAVLATVTLIAADIAGLTPGAHRYLVGINVVLAYVAARRMAFRGALSVATLTTAIGMGLFFELAQLMYALPAIVAIVAIDILREPRARANWRGPALCMGILLLVGLPLVAILAWKGMLAGAWTFYAHLSDSVQYSAFPTYPVVEPWPEFPIEAVVLWFPCVLMVVGMAEAFTEDPQASTRAAALVGLSVLNFVVLQKHLVRPMQAQLVLFALAGGLAYGVLGPIRVRWSIRVGAAVGAGVVLALLSILGRLDSTGAALQAAPARLARSLKTLIDPAVSAEVNRARFAPERFGLYRTQGRLIQQLTLRHRDAVTVFGLTDDPIVYVLTRQAMWLANLYNASPVYEQRRVVAQLEQLTPDYVVIDRTRLSFDEVPLPVRLPDVLAYVIERYVPDEPIPPYTVLKRRAPGEPIAAQFWVEALGPTLDLGYVPAALAREDRQPCQAAADCVDVVIVRAEGGHPTGAALVEVGGPGFTVTATFQLTSRQREYVVPLSRLWPTTAANGAGLQVALRSPPGLTIERQRVVRVPARLY